MAIGLLLQRFCYWESAVGGLEPKGTSIRIPFGNGVN